MKYTVLWMPRAERSLAEIWMETGDRQQIADAANSIDRTLRYDPEMCGESRQGTVRIIFVSPLGAEFEVFERDRIVRVLSVWKIRPRKS